MQLCNGLNTDELKFPFSRCSRSVMPRQHTAFKNATMFFVGRRSLLFYMMSRYVNAILLHVYFGNLFLPNLTRAPKLTVALGFHYSASLADFQSEEPTSTPQQTTRGRDHTRHITRPHAHPMEDISVEATVPAGDGSQYRFVPDASVTETDARASAVHSLSCDGTRCSAITNSSATAFHQDLSNDVYLAFPSAEQRILFYLPPPQLPPGMSSDQLTMFLSKIKGVPLLIPGPFDVFTNTTTVLTFVTQASSIWSNSISIVGSLLTMVQRLWKEIFLMPFQVLGPSPHISTRPGPYNNSTTTTTAPTGTTATSAVTPPPVRLGPAPG